MHTFLLLSRKGIPLDNTIDVIFLVSLVFYRVFPCHSGTSRTLQRVAGSLISRILWTSTVNRYLAIPVMGVAGALGLQGCISLGDSAFVSYGVQDGLEGYVPARIGILNCQIWPLSAFYERRGPLTAPESVVAEICTGFDAFILQGFERQPYMKGLSPRFVNQALSGKNLQSPSAVIHRVWAREGGPCTGCASPLVYYKTKVMPSASWQIWLGELSQSARNADAILLPLILSAEESRYHERGIAVAERSAEILLLLIDTASGRLMWAGGRQVHLPEKRLAQDLQQPDFDPPPWSDVTQRLFVEPVWQDFPGRKTL